MNFKLIGGVVVIAVLVIGALVGMFLVNQTQDIRQQAAMEDEGSGCPTTCNAGETSCDGGVSYECVYYSQYCNPNGVWKAQGDACSSGGGDTGGDTGGGDDSQTEEYKTITCYNVNKECKAVSISVNTSDTRSKDKKCKSESSNYYGSYDACNSILASQIDDEAACWTINENQDGCVGPTVEYCYTSPNYSSMNDCAVAVQDLLDQSAEEHCPGGYSTSIDTQACYDSGKVPVTEPSEPNGTFPCYACQPASYYQEDINCYERTTSGCSLVTKYYSSSSPKTCSDFGLYSSQSECSSLGEDYILCFSPSNQCSAQTYAIDSSHSSCSDYSGIYASESVCNTILAMEEDQDPNKKTCAVYTTNEGCSFVTYYLTTPDQGKSCSELGDAYGSIYGVIKTHADINECYLEHPGETLGDNYPIPAGAFCPVLANSCVCEDGPDLDKVIQPGETCTPISECFYYAETEGCYSDECYDWTDPSVTYSSMGECQAEHPTCTKVGDCVDGKTCIYIGNELEAAGASCNESSQISCGDDICEGSEWYGSCPDDCNDQDHDEAVTCSFDMSQTSCKGKSYSFVCLTTDNKEGYCTPGSTRDDYGRASCTCTGGGAEGSGCLSNSDCSTGYSCNQTTKKCEIDNTDGTGGTGGGQTSGLTCPDGQPAAITAKFTCGGDSGPCADFGNGGLECRSGDVIYSTDTKLTLATGECGQIDYYTAKQADGTPDWSTYCGHEGPVCTGCESTNPPADDDDPDVPDNPPTGPQCLNISMLDAQNQTITSADINDQVKFQCGQVSGVSRYDFRLIYPDGQRVKKLGTESNNPSRISPVFSINQSGKYAAQCRVCVKNGSALECQPFETIPN